MRSFSGWRAGAGSVSGNMRQQIASSTSPTVTSRPNTARQPQCAYSRPPTIGAMTGATPKKMVICAIVFCASDGPNRSRTTARETTMPAPVDSPCRARKKISCPIVCDSAQPTEASVNTASPTSTTGRRPKLSDSAP